MLDTAISYLTKEKNMESIRCYCTGEPIIYFKEEKIIVDWEGFGLLYDCYTDASVLEHTDAAWKNYVEVIKALCEHNILVSDDDFAGEAYEVVIVPVILIKPSQLAPAGTRLPVNIESLPAKSFLYFDDKIIRRFRNNSGRECIEYEIEGIAGLFRNKEDAIACAKGYKNYIEKDFLKRIPGQIHVRKVGFFSEDDQKKYAYYPTANFIEAIEY